MLGAASFFLGRPLPSALRCGSSRALVLTLGRPAYAKLLMEQPRALAALQMLLLCAAMLDLVAAEDAAQCANED